MVLKTCLLVSDDPDDMIWFTEALYEVSEHIVVLAVMDVRKAVDLLLLKRHVPDYVIADLQLLENGDDALITLLSRDPELSNIPLVAFGELEQLRNPAHAGVAMFIDRESTYSGLRGVLTRLVRGDQASRA